MRFEAALVEEQGVEFAVAVVRPAITANRSRAEEAIEAFAQFFPGVPVVVMSQDAHGVPTYFGRTDLVRFLSSIDMMRLPWREWSTN